MNANFQEKRTTLTLLTKICPNMGFGVRISIFLVWIRTECAFLRYCVHKTNNFEFLGPNLLKNGFWGWNFKNWSLDLVGMNTSNLRKLPNYVQYFDSNIDEGVAES